MENRLDILLFGATGFTGIHCIPYIVKLSKEKGRNLSWGVAGRSEDKLKEILKEMGEKLEVDFEAIPIVVADVSNYTSLVDMAKRAKVIINCCGPFRFLGEPVVKACIEAGAHHVDVSGEPEYMEKMQLEHHDAALEKGVYAISACGFDCIPTDLGVLFLQQNFEGTLNSVETYLRVYSDVPTKGPVGNFTTWESAVHSLANRNDLKDIRERFYQKFKKAPSFSPKLKKKALPHKTDMANKGWSLVFPAADSSVAFRTQNYMYEHENRRPIQVGTYLVIPTFFHVAILLLFGLIFYTLANFKLGRKLLLSYPEIFSCGHFSKKQPSEETIKNSRFAIDFYGEGWKEKLANKDDQYTTPVDTTIRAQVKGENLGYGFTCLAAVLAGITVLTEKDKLANEGKGGIYPPGAAFAKTSLIKELKENNFTFEVTSQKDD